MTQREPDSDACPACRGRGWKLVRSRRAVIIGTLLRGGAAATRRDCPACNGTGRAG
jgi:DnaJ-class molecular chaperone